MLKKLVIAAAAVVVGLLIVKKTHVGSLMQVWWKDTSCWVTRQVPPETRIKQLKIEVDRIDGDIKHAVNQMVKQEVARDELRQEIEGLKKRQDQRKKDVKVLKDGLEQGSTKVSLNGHTYGETSAQFRLDGLVAEFKTGAEALKVKQELLKSKDEQLDLADQRITRIRQKKGELSELVVKMESQLELLRLKQVDNSAIEVNDTQVNKADLLAQDIKRMLAEEEKKAEKYARYGLTVTAPRTETEDRTRAESIKAAKEVLADEEVAGNK